MVTWLLGWLIGWLVGWLADWLVNWLVGWLLGYLVVCWLLGWLVSWLVDWLADWLLACLLACLFGCLTVWLVNWLVILFYIYNHFEVFLETDKRGASFIDSNKYKYKVFSSVKLDSFFTIPINLFKIIILFVNSIIYLKKNNFNIIISTGGYMSIPTCFAAKILGLDIFLLELSIVY